jgi:hypothetical protein
LPPGSEEVVTDSCGPATVMLSDCVAVALELSLTCTAKLAAAAAVGVPLMPPPAESDSPAGSDPLLTDHVYPPVPPAAPSCCE